MSPTIAEFFFRTPHSDIGDFAFGDQGASPLEPDRQGAGAEYLRSGKTVPVFPPEGGGSGRDRQGCTGAAHRSGRRKARFFAGFRHSLRLLPPEVTRGTSRC